jgi:hypothetical protein
MIYKIISKLLANRLKWILPKIIGEQQSVFVLGRMITVNILAIYECVHTIKKKTGKQGFCAVKLDMHKAYNRVEWSLLREMMVKLEFEDRWINLMMECVSSVRYRVRFNSSETINTFQIEVYNKGILSSLIFLICAEGLSSLLSSAEEEGSLEGVKVCRDSPSVSHLLFADDSLILIILMQFVGKVY